MHECIPMFGGFVVGFGIAIALLTGITIKRVFKIAELRKLLLKMEEDRDEWRREAIQAVYSIGRLCEHYTCSNSPCDGCAYCDALAARDQVVKKSFLDGSGVTNPSSRGAVP